MQIRLVNESTRRIMLDGGICADVPAKGFLDIDAEASTLAFTVIPDGQSSFSHGWKKNRLRQVLVEEPLGDLLNGCAGLPLVLVTLPIYLLGRKNPEAAAALTSILAFVMFAFLALVVLLIVVLILNGIFHFWY